MSAELSNQFPAIQYPMEIGRIDFFRIVISSEVEHYAVNVPAQARKNGKSATATDAGVRDVLRGIWGK